MKTGIFQLTEADRPALAQHLLRLSAEDRRSRFFCPVSDSAIEGFVRNLDINRVFGFFVAGQMVASSMVMPEDERRVEFAVSVDSEHRGRGLAKRLLDHGLNTVWADRADQVVIRHVSDNHAMAAVHRGLPSRQSISAGEVDVVIDLEQLRQLEQDTMSRLVGQEV